MVFKLKSIQLTRLETLLYIKLFKFRKGALQLNYELLSALTYLQNELEKYVDKCMHRPHYDEINLEIDDIESILIVKEYLKLEIQSNVYARLPDERALLESVIRSLEQGLEREHFIS